MKEDIVELGINTLPEYRNQGYAKIILGVASRYVTNSKKVPIVSCASSNTASQKVDTCFRGNSIMGEKKVVLCF